MTNNVCLEAAMYAASENYSVARYNFEECASETDALAESWMAEALQTATLHQPGA